MMRVASYGVFFALLLFSMAISAQDTVYWEANFDTPSTSNLLIDVPNTPQNWQIGSSQKPFMFQNGNFGSRCLITDTLDTLLPQDTLVASIRILGLPNYQAGYPPVIISFKQNYNFVEGDSLSIEFYVSGDSNKIDILNDTTFLLRYNGEKLMNLSFESNDSQGWIQSQFAIDITNFALSNNVWHYDTLNLMFTLFTSEESTNSNGWAVDDFRVRLPLLNLIHESKNRPQATIYPSPAQEWVRVVLPDNVQTEPVRYGIYDMLGSLKQEGTVNSDGLIGFDETLSDGVYVIELEIQQKKYTSKFIVSSN